MARVHDWDQKKWIEEKLAEQRRLYDLHGRSLEAEYLGKFVAINSEGETLLGGREGEVLKLALENFGRGNFALVRVGHESIYDWVSLL